MIEVCSCDNEYLMWSEERNEYVCEGCGLPIDEYPIRRIPWCPVCNGRGDFDGFPCEHCDGTGKEWWDE